MAAEALPDDSWASGFQTANSRAVLLQLQRRLHTSTTHVQTLAELFRERAAIENEYATKLSKLARTAESGQLGGKGSVIDWDPRSAEGRLFGAAISDLQETSSSHASLSNTLRTDFEQPVRDLPNKVTAWRRIGDQESTLDRMLKDYEKTAAKLEKAASKKSGKNKAEQFQSELNQISSQLASQTPTCWKTFQRLDEERLRALKEVLVRWSTARADTATRDGQRAEAGLAELLSWECQDEVIAVGNRISTTSGGRGMSVSQSQAPQIPPIQPSSPRASILTTGTSTQEHAPSHAPSHASSPTHELTPGRSKANGSSTNLTSGGGGLSGFKSMLTRKATSVGRQRSGSEAPSVNKGRRGTNDTFEPLTERPEARQTPRSEKVPSRPPVLSSPPVDEEGFSIAPADRHKNPWDEPSDALATPSRPTTNYGVALPSAIFAEQGSSGGHESPTPASASSAGGHDLGSSTASIKSTTAPRLNLELAAQPIQESEEERKAAVAKMQQTLQMAPPPGPARRSTIARGRRAERQTLQASIDENGPLPQHHMAALAQMGNDEDRQERLADGASVRSMRSARSSSLAAPTGPELNRRSSRSSVASSRNPFDSPGLGGAGGSVPVPAPVFASSSSSGPAPVAPVTPSANGTRAAGAAAAGAVGGAGAAALGASVFTSEPESIPAASPSTVPTSPTFPGSPTSPTSTALVTAPTSPAVSSVPLSSPPMMPGLAAAVESVPGLRATVVETVHAFVRQFNSQRTVITGEIAVSLSASPARPLPPSGTVLHLRLTEFNSLESVAPNPAFLSQVPDRPGEYFLNTDLLAQATPEAEAMTGYGPVLFKYHVLVPEGGETAMAPLLLNPAFKIQDGETRMILHYRSTATSGVSALALAVTFPDEPAVTSTQSKPVTPTWGRAPSGTDKQVVWQPANPAPGTENKIIARFVTSPGAPRLAPTGVEARFVIPDHLASGVGIEVVSGEVPDAASGWEFDSVSKSTVAGKYVGAPYLNP